MNISIIAIPDLLPDDVEYLQELRSRHDPHAGECAQPHLTVVSPTDIPAARVVIDHVREIAGSVSAFPFALRCALPVHDPASGLTCVYLVPDRGFSSVVRMHDLLYYGPLREALRLDVPFIPHLKVAEFADAGRAKQLADRLNADGVTVMGTVSSLEVVEVDGGRFEPLAHIALAEAAGVPASRMH